MKNSRGTEDSGESKRAIAMMAMVVGSVVISFSGLVIRSLEQADGWHISFYRAIALMSAVFLTLLFQYRRAVFTRIKSIGRPGLIGGACMSIASITFMQAMTTTTVANTLFMLGSIPFFTALLARLILGEALKRETVVTMLVAGCGIALMLGDGLGGGSLFGNSMAFVTAIAFAGYAVVVRYNRSVDMLPTLLVSTVLVIIVLGIVRSEKLLDVPLYDIVLCFMLGSCMSWAVNWLFIFASRHLAAAEVTLFMLIEFALGPIWVWLFVSETPTAMTVLGGVLILGAVGVRAVIQLNRVRRLRRRPVPITSP